ncbi:MAG: transaldolase [Candidatus Wildermuthbacteria bacterium RIFCSPLOWO2_01_FULL_48_29]|uniref:Transaldolase n=2 Tax=Candidatus Wildermuthiibacteriota TaxID=1817923 RepID=A0A1G2RP10_9BACT|nr:MAG: transaldolase [Candidatus Wildermuthbacteria bacterium RIFCSPHIGHO2_01_FULL_48_27b]OHA74208.1 MAG: transaldolase [Candidatus Wildermuthbacteria bacterium RIFCSPLOWO2_01_FULL_48_29]
MKPENLRTKIFLDSGDPAETKETMAFLGFLDGQTTNPSLIAKNPETAGKKFTREELLGFYRGVVEEVSRVIPEGSVSIEVYADKHTSAEEMLRQGREMFAWIPNAHIKYPTTREGLKAAQQSVKEGMRVNMTLVFSQQQAAAVYAATRGAKRGNVFLSPFIGRLDDRGENGMDLIENILKMYQKGDGHVEVLTASVRNLHHLLAAVQLGSDILTSPLKVLREWAQAGLPAREDFYKPEALTPILYEELNLEQDWTAFDISHELTDVGVERFSADWNALLS